MSKSTRHIGSLALALAGLVTSGGAFAQGTWDLDACVRTGSCSSGGSTVTVTGWYSNGTTSAFQSGSLNVGTDWMGVGSRNSTGTAESTTSPHHAIDNYSGSGASYAELVYLNFTKAVDISSIASVWTYGGAGTGDFQLWRWNNVSTGPGAISGYNASTMSGWTSVTTTNGDFGTTAAQTVSDGLYYSSHWLVTTKFGGSNDAFKLGTVYAANVCATSPSSSSVCGPTPGPGVPEPMSLALFGVAALGAAAARRRAMAQRG